MNLPGAIPALVDILQYPCSTLTLHFQRSFRQDRAKKEGL